MKIWLNEFPVETMKGEENFKTYSSYTIKYLGLGACKGFCGYDWLAEISFKTWVGSDWGKGGSISKNGIGKGGTVSQSLGQSQGS